MVGPRRVLVGQSQEPPAGGIERPDDTAEIHDEQAGGQAGDDFIAEPLGRFGAGLHRALLQSQVVKRFFHRGGDERRLASLGRRALGEPTGGDHELDDRVGQHTRQRRDYGSEAEEKVGGLVHDVLTDIVVYPAQRP
jgi:hypothetical protein